jgi:hypothetical protein
MGGKRWSEAEKAAIAQMAKEGVFLIDGMDRLPGRTYDSARIYASKLGIAMKDAIVWTEEERAILRQIYRSKESIKVGMSKLLPHRGYIAAKGEASRLGLCGTKKRRGRTGYSWVERAVEQSLERHELLTVEDLVAKTGASVSSIGRALQRLHGKKAHIGGWARPNGIGDYAARWEAGGGPDAPRPPRKTAREACRDFRKKQQIRAGRVDPFATLIQQVAA